MEKIEQYPADLAPVMLAGLDDYLKYAEVRLDVYGNAQRDIWLEEEQLEQAQAIFRAHGVEEPTAVELGFYDEKPYTAGGNTTPGILTAHVATLYSDGFKVIYSAVQREGESPVLSRIAEAAPLAKNRQDYRSSGRYLFHYLLVSSAEHRVGLDEVDPQEESALNELVTTLANSRVY